MEFGKLIEKVDNEPLSKVLPVVLRVAQLVGDKHLEKWVRLELNGYLNTNPALDDNVVVPEYRTVSGQHSDDFGRPLVITQNKLNFVNLDRLRYGVAELEQLAERNGTYSYRDPAMSKLILDNLGVEVAIFTFHASQISGVLSAIKTELSDRLMAIKNKLGRSDLNAVSIPPNEDILVLKPNFYGLGINLNALVRKLKTLFSKKK